MTQATLPDNMIERTLRDLVIGESAYVVPWMMWVDTDRKCWLLLSAHPNREPHGTACMRVEVRKDGWHVWKAPGDYGLYSVRDMAPHVGVRDPDHYAPVAELHT